jgi:hypothetical protein
VNANTPCCPGCGNKFPGLPCRRCGLTPDEIKAQRIMRIVARVKDAIDRDNAAKETRRLKLLRMPSATRRRRKHGMPPR